MASEEQDQMLHSEPMAQPPRNGDEQQHFRELLGKGDAFLELDSEWRIVGSSASPQSPERKPRTEVLGRLFWDVWPKTEDPRGGGWREYSRCMVERVPVQFDEYHAEHARWASVTAHPTSTGGIAIFLRDITEQKSAESALKESEGRLRLANEQLSVERARLEAIIRTLPVGIEISGSRAIPLSMNEVALRLHGLTSEAERLEELPDLRTTIEVLDPEGRPIPFEEWPRSKAMRGELVQSFECRLRNARAGTEPWVSITTVSVQGAIGPTALTVSVLEDISERKRAEKQLRDEERRYRSLFENSLDAVYFTREDGTVIDANPAACRFHRMTKDEIRQRGRDGLVVPDPALGRAVGERIETGHSRAELRLLRKDGSSLPVEVESVVVDPAGADWTAFAIAHDITERLGAEKALRESEQKFATIFHRSPLAKLYAELPGGTIADVNDAWVSLMGISREEALGKTALELGLVADAEAQARFYEEMRTSGSVERFELTQATRSHGICTFWVNADLVTLDGKPCLLAAMLDITDQKRAEAERERLATAIEQAAEEVMITDARGTLVYVNPAFEAVTGYSRVEALGRTPRILKSGVQDDAFYRALWETILAGKTWRGRMINRKKDGANIPEEVTISPVRDAAGVITGFVAVERDISRDLAAEAQLFQAQKMEGIGQLAGGVAHDFNNLLSVILSCAEFALGKLREGDPLREDMKEIEEAGRRAASLTRQLLAFSRKQVLQPEPLDLNRILVEMERMLRRIIGEDIDLVQVLAPDLGIVKADPAQMEQVVMNLAVNARDAMPQGGKLTIESANVELDDEHVARHPGFQVGPHVMVAISDSGIGMDEGTMARIFEPFFTTKEPGKGSGLGLSTVYGIVRQSGGNIHVYSELGKGTTFKVYFPRELATEPIARRSATPRRTRGAETVLVVEDHDGVRGVARRILEGAGYTVLTASNGGEGLLLCEQHPTGIHLVLTDVVMPLMSGRVFVERLARARPGVKVLYMSGYTDNAIVHQGVLDMGARFISKPLTQAELLRKVRETLDNE